MTVSENDKKRSIAALSNKGRFLRQIQDRTDKEAVKRVTHSELIAAARETADKPVLVRPTWDHERKIGA